MSFRRLTQVSSRFAKRSFSPSNQLTRSRIPSYLPNSNIATTTNTTTNTPSRLSRPFTTTSRVHASVAAELKNDEASATTNSDPNANLSPEELSKLMRLRNIGISAHIDSGKTTLTERILYYTGRIEEIHEVRGKDNVGAKMDSMELEREKGITIQSAATYTQWDLNDDTYNINIIDTPGHVDFTIEVERALRVLDGAILVLCAVGGVQSQTITVDRQMKRYAVPRICFINKLDRAGSNPFRVIDQIRTKLHLNAAAVQIPIGLEDNLKGAVDLVKMKAYYNEGERGENIVTKDIPSELMEQAKERRAEMIAAIAEVDDEIAELFLEETEPTAQQLIDAIRRTTIARTFVPVFMGSAYHNTAVQPMLDGVCMYLPAPHQVDINALDQQHHEKPVLLSSAAKDPFVALAFKLEEGRFGQLTYLRVYQGTLSRGMFISNVKNGKRVKVSRLVRMHSNEMEDVEEVSAGEICALFGIECASGDTFTDGAVQYTMTSIYVPPAVISLSITPKKDSPNFSKALNRFTKEDPTFRVHVDSESKETIISGMGELHLDIYVERMRREYNVECITGKPQVAFRETITSRIPFNYTHKKQSGGSGQYGKVMGYIEAIDADEVDMDADADTTVDVNEKEAEIKSGDTVEFVDSTVGMNIPGQYIPACEKGFKEACEKGFLIGHPIRNVRFVLEDGMAHSVDSSEMAFKIAAASAFREAFFKANPQILEPVMAVSVTAPAEYQGTLVSLLNKRRGTIQDSTVADHYVEVTAEVPLNDMFGFSTDLRSSTQGKGEFSMEYRRHAPVYPNVQEDLIKAYEKKRLEAAAAKK